MRVKLIPPTYYQLVKHGFLQAHHLAETSVEKELPVLGGLYQVIKERENKHYKWVINVAEQYNSIWPTNYFLPYADSLDCPYKVGDKVYFSPKCSEEDLSFVLSLSSIGIEQEDVNSKESSFEIRHVLNSYYIFISSDFKKDPDGYIYKGFPFRWIDFEKV